MQSKLINANKPIQISKNGQKVNFKQHQPAGKQIMQSQATIGSNSATDLAIMRANTQKLKHYLNNQSLKLQQNQQQLQSTINQK